MIHRGLKITALVLAGLLIAPQLALGAPVGNPSSNKISASMDVAIRELNMQIEGRGTVDPPQGPHIYEVGAEVDIAATPRAGWRFDHWVGDVADAESPFTTVVMDSNKTITAVFAEVPPLPPPPSQPSYIPVLGVKLNKTSMTLNPNETRTLISIFNPLDATDKNVSWSSENPKVVRVDGGVVTAVGPGTTQIIATAEDGGYKARCRVTVVVPVTGIRPVGPTKLIVYPGSAGDFNAVAEPEDATNSEIIWATSDPDVARVNGNGLVTGLSPGTATITAATAAGGFKAFFKVTVAVPVQGINLHQESLTLQVGERSQVQASVSPEDATNAVITWTSSNENVAVVDERGIVTGLSAGEATITATTLDGGFSDTCIVTVEGEADLPVISDVRVQTPSGPALLNSDGCYMVEVNRAVVSFTVTHDSPVVTTVNGVQAGDSAAVTLEYGDNVVTIEARDEAGNFATRELVITRADETPPVIGRIEITGSDGVLNPNQQGEYVVESQEVMEVTVSVAVAEINPFVVSINGQVVEPYQAAISLFAGDNDIKIKAEDESGNYASRTVTVRRVLPPVVPAQVQVPEERDETYAAELEDGSAGVEVNPDVQAVDEQTGEPLAGGLQFTVQARDEEGEGETPPPTGGFKIAGRVYSISANDESGGSVRQFSSPLKLSFSYADLGLGPDDPVRVHCYDEDLGQWIQLRVGVHGVTRIYNDEENRVVHVWITQLTDFALMRDDEAPEAPVVDPLPELVEDDTLVVSGNAEPLSTIKVFVNGEPAGSAAALDDGTFTVEVTLTTRGSNEVTVTATDDSGNVSEPSATQVVNCQGGLLMELDIDNPVAYVNGVEFVLDVPPTIRNYRAIVPCRFIGESLDAYVGWIGETDTVIVDDSLRDIYLVLRIGDNMVEVNGSPVEIDVAPEMVAGRTLIPLRFVAEGLNCDVNYHDGHITITR